MDLVEPQLDALQGACLSLRSSVKFKGILEVLFALGTVFEATTQAITKKIRTGRQAFGFKINR